MKSRLGPLRCSASEARDGWVLTVARPPGAGGVGGPPRRGGVTLGGRAKTTGSSTSGVNSSTSNRRALHTFLATVASAAIRAIAPRSGPARDCPRRSRLRAYSLGAGSGEGTALGDPPSPLRAPPGRKGWCLLPWDWGKRPGKVRKSWTQEPGKRTLAQKAE